MVEVLERVVVRRTRTEIEYTGTAMMYNGIQDKQALLDALDSNNFGGTVEFRKTDKPNVFTFFADVYFD